MNRILEVTDEDESLILQFVDLEDLRNEGSSRDSRPNGRRAAGENPSPATSVT